MSRTTEWINKITRTVIAISGRLIICALVVLFLYQGVVKGFEFGHEIFYATSVDGEPGISKDVTVKEGMSVFDTAKLLKEKGLILNEYSLIIQAIFFDYDVNPGTYTFTTAMTSKEMLQVMDDNAAEEETDQ